MRYVVFGHDSSRTLPTSPVRPSSATDRHSYPHGAVGVATAATHVQEIRSNFVLAIFKTKVCSLMLELRFFGIEIDNYFSRIWNP